MGAGAGEVLSGWAAASSPGTVSISCSIAWITPSLRKKLRRQYRIYYAQHWGVQFGSMHSMMQLGDRVLRKLQHIVESWQDLSVQSTIVMQTVHWFMQALLLGFGRWLRLRFSAL